VSDLASRTALHGIATSGRFGKTDGEAGVLIAERTGLGLASVAVRKGKGDALKASMKDSYDLALPLDSTVATGSEMSVIGTAPGQWLAVSGKLAYEALAEDLAAKLNGIGSISDQSSGRAVIRIGGPRARDVLAKGLAIDLDPRAFPPGSAATSTIAHMGVLVWREGDAESYDIVLFRSVAESFWRWITTSASEFGYEVVTES
jgi:heterotetrameric sarcosine oxidase gamma subunit